MRFLDSPLPALATLSALSQIVRGATAESYDYIIVGAGTAGSVLANRLSQDSKFTVAIVDPGADERHNPNITDPLGIGQALGGHTNWRYSSVKQPQLGNRSIEFDAGRGIGGTSLVNGLAYVRGDKAEFDAWEELGNEGWNWDTLLRHYRGQEKFFPPQDWQIADGATFEPEFHGTSGDIHVGFNPAMPNGTFFSSARESWAVLGQLKNPDVNDGDTQGFAVWPQTLDPDQNVRWDAATAFLWPASTRKNLHLVNGTVSRITWKPASRGCLPEASGIEYIAPNNQRKTLVANKEVIISAGTLRTPLVLESSGIGNSALLRKLGIKTVVDSPGVGEHMTDQPQNRITFGTKDFFGGFPPYASFVNASGIFGSDLESVATASRANISSWAKDIEAASNGAVKALAIEKFFEIQHDLIFQKGVTIHEISTTTGGTQAFSAYWFLLPFSRGSVHLSSADDINNPVINPRYLTTGLDVAAQVYAGRLATKLWNTAPLSDLVTGEISPSRAQLPPDATDAQWESYNAESLVATAHSIGTASMMSRELGGVVDPQLKVYGTSNIRVVDASVLPMQFSGHTTATLYAVADRAADIIIQARARRNTGY